MTEHIFEPKPGWNSATDNIVDDFYRPALRECVRYDRLAGFFDSSTFAVALREAIDFVERGGRMRLITSAKFSQADLDVIKKSVDERLLDDISSIMEDDLGKKCLRLFAHMLTKKIDGKPQLDIRILVPPRPGMFHAKVGIFKLKNGDVVTFSGSVNETGMGWTGNIEEFKVFCSWVDKKFVDLDIDSFNKFWCGSYMNIQSFALSRAVREEILNVRPGSDEEYKRLLRELKATFGYGQVRERTKLVLRDYQKNAVDSWFSRGCKGILEMPTATGKTFTAMGCIRRMQRNDERLFTIIVVPYTHLAQQWIDNVNKWNQWAGPDQKISSRTLITSGSPSWKIKLGRAITVFNKKKLGGGYVTNDYIVCTTYNTLATKPFVDQIKKIKGNILLIADEAHHAGSKISRKGLLDIYSGRLALTATPERYFDEEGSSIIRSYFGDVAYSMTIRGAIRDGHLVPYDYHPRFVEMTEEETAEYVKLTRAIAVKLSKKKNRAPIDDKSNTPENRRARLVAKMERKYYELAAILDEHDDILENALIYCHDTEQLKKVESMLTERNINFDEITSASNMIERRDKIRSLERKNHQCIVSMRCLDEGVDIPSARLGIILASTGNTRQYVQRRGRLLRLSDGKDHAEIYDLLAMATPEADDKPFARKLFAKELLRHKEFAEEARNRQDALEKIRPVAERLGIDLDRLDLDYVLGL